MPLREVLQVSGWLKFKHIQKKIEIQDHLWTVTNYAKEGKKIQGPNL